MAPRKQRVKQNLAPVLVETSSYTKGFNSKLPQDELPAGSATGSSYNFFLDGDGKWTTRLGSKYLGNPIRTTTLITSNSESFNDSDVSVDSSDLIVVGQIFTASSTGLLNKCKFYLNKLGSPTGLMYARLYAVSGTIGTNAKPADSSSPLAISDSVDASTVTAGFNYYTFTFSGSNKVELTAGVNYGIAFYFAGGNSGNKILWEDATASGYAGNEFFSYDGTTWTAGTAGYDAIFSVYIDIADTGRCTSSAKLLRRDGVELPIVFYSTKSIYLHPDTLDWVTLETGYTDGLIFGRAMGEKTTDNVNYLVFGNGTDPYRYWNGITGTVASFTVNTITLTGTTTLADRGFTATGSISDNGTQYTYTGLSGSTFTGVTTDPTGVMVAGNPIAQMPVNNSGLPYGNVMCSYAGRVVMFNKNSAALYGGGSLVGSVLNNYASFSFSTPRVASEGYQLMMAEGGGSGTAIVHYENGLACFKQNAVNFHQVTYDANDAPSLQPLLPYDDTIAGHIGCVGQKLAFALRNQVFFVSPRKVINTLQRVSQVDYPQSLPMSDRIQTTVDNMTWDTNCCGIGFNYLARFCGKSESTDISPNKQLIYDQRFDCWWTPFIGQSISSYFVYGGKLHGTLADSPRVIELDTGYSDFATSTTNGNKINANLTLERQNFGRKSARKKSHRLFVEGWMSVAGTATFTLQLDENGKSYTGTLSGSESAYFFESNQDGTFGSEGFGVDTFGGSWVQDSSLPDGVGHFRILFNFPSSSFWNVQMTIDTSNYFKLINHSTDSTLTDVAVAGSLKKGLS